MDLLLFYNTYRYRIRKIFLAAVLVAGLVLLLLLPGIINEWFYLEGHYVLDALKRLFLSLAFLLIPIAGFYNDIKIYLYLLTFWIILAPLFIYSLILFEVRPTFELVFLVLQTNTTEVREITKGYWGIFLLATGAYLALYLFGVKRMPFKRIPYTTALVISFLSAGIVVTQCYRYLYIQRQSGYHFFSRYYPVSIISGIAEAYTIVSKNTSDHSKNFSFNAFKKDTLAQRQVYVLIIGETSRYDRWQINGYHRSTSPRLNQRKNLINFPDVASGSNLTWLSVPQMITRACPENMDLQFTEKSNLSAFKNAGFKTAWLSSQSDQQIIWLGSIIMHAKDADIDYFTKTNSPIFELENIFDEGLLPRLDSIINSDNKSLFVVLHTMGNHWDYSRRYPDKFNVFTPSGQDYPIGERGVNNKDLISNAYDNSIVYADFIIDSVISMVEKLQAVSYVAFLSDHGEELFDNGAEELRFHTQITPSTLHVPFFLWVSDLYKHFYPEKVLAILNNRKKSIGADNVFYSLLDMANITFDGMDTSKSIASNAFQVSPQKYYDHFNRRANRYKDLIRSSLSVNNSYSMFFKLR